MSSNMGRSFEGLAPEERLKRYRQFAEDALGMAQTASSEELRAGYLTMANGWFVLAGEMERQTQKSAPPPAADPAADLERNTD